MRITVLKDNLRKALGITQRIATRNTSLPILENILLNVESKRIKLSATNLEIGVHYWVKGKVEKEGKVSVPAGVLSLMVGGIKEERITLETKKLDLDVSTESFHATIKGYDYNDFPIIPSLEETGGITIKGSVLFLALSQLGNSMTVSETYPEISGVFWRLLENKLELVATDSFRLGRKILSVDIPKDLAGREFTLPFRSVLELMTILQENKEGSLNIVFNENQILCVSDGVHMVSRLLSGKYPNYEDLIPKDFGLVLRVKREELVSQIKLASVLSPKTNDIKMEFLDKKIRLSTQTQSGMSQAEVPCQVEGSGVSAMMFNFRYLLDGLSNIEAKEVEMKLKHEASPLLCQGVGEKSYMYVVMPLKS